MLQEDTPGPGSYGEGGVPSARLERRKSASNVGTMEGSSSRRELSTRSAVSLSILITCHRRDNCNTISKQLLYS